MFKKLLKIFSQNKVAALLILVGTIIWSLTMVKSGLPRSYGLGFWGPNGHDGVWHVALAESLSRGSFDMPTFAGAKLQNYHIGFDLLLASVHKLTGIRIDTLYFQVFPPVLAFLIGVLSYWFVLSWTKSKKAAIWSLFFVYFGGGWGWLVNLIRSGEVGGESMFWSQQAISTLINPPFALSLVLILGGLFYLMKAKERPKIYDLGFMSLIFGSLIQIKAYAGILVLGALFISGLYSCILHHRSYILKIWTGSLIFSLLLFIPFNKNPQGLLVYKPFWFLETMMGFADRLGWPRFYSAMTNYRMGGVWVKGVLAYSAAFLIFWYGNLGTRLVKEVLVFKWIRNFKKLTWVEIFLASVIIGGGLIPMFFLQKGTPWNTIQFLYYSLFFSGILAGVGMVELTKRLKDKTYMIYIIEAAVVLLTLPTTIGTLRHYLPSRPPSMLPRDEQEALKFLSKQPSGVVLTYPFDREKAKAAEPNPPRPLYLYESTAYVSAFSQKPTYLEDEINLDITGYDWKERRKKVENFFASNDADDAKSFLEENNISYIYLTGDQKEISGFTKIFENRVAKVFKVE